MSFCPLYYGCHRLFIAFEEVLVIRDRFQQMLVALEELLAEVHSEWLHLTSDIPRLLVVHPFVYVLYNPWHKSLVLVESLHNGVDCFGNNLTIVERYAEVVAKTKFLDHIAEYALEEGVNGLDTELVVVVQEVMKCDICVLAHKFLGNIEFLRYLVQIGIAAF